MEDALSGFRGVTDGECPQKVSEKLPTEDALNGFRGVTDRGCP
jgi:hypothetical protein